MKDTVPRLTPSHANAPDPRPSTDPGASDIQAATVPSMTVEQWEASQPRYPFPRVSRKTVAHMYKGFPFSPPSRILEPTRKYVKLVYRWLSQQPKPTSGQNGTEAS